LDVYVRTLSASATTGIVIAGGRTMRCAIGRGGIGARKREGDGASPRGAWRVMWAVYRCDRVRRVAAGVPMRPIRETDGWCDAPADRNYNRPVRLPYPASAERMHRDDGLYDYVVVLDYNMNARRRGLGSAIFLHCARDGYAPTAGCLALSRADLQWLLRRLTPRSRVRFGV
jgi:L,D-peptidoglycan transpeptidase YkuD (ErfK/YbiS/YcfS/YnhG family)